MASPTRHVPIAMDAATFRDIGHRLVDKLAELIESLPERPVTRDVAPRPSAARSA